MRWRTAETVPGAVIDTGVAIFGALLGTSIYTYEVTVTDERGNTVTETVDVTVIGEPDI